MRTAYWFLVGFTLGYSHGYGSCQRETIRRIRNIARTVHAHREEARDAASRD